MMDDNQLRLTARQQSMLAEFCLLLRAWLYQELKSQGAGDDSLLVRELAETMDKFCTTPQQLDELYDKLHRTGANAE